MSEAAPNLEYLTRQSNFKVKHINYSCRINSKLPLKSAAVNRQRTRVNHIAVISLEEHHSQLQR